GASAFFSGGGDRIVTLVSMDEELSAKGIINTGSTIYSLKYIPQQKILIVGISGGEIHIIDLEKKKEIHFLKFHDKGVFDINYSQKHGVMIAAGGDGKISFWSLDDFSFIKSDYLCD